MFGPHILSRSFFVTSFLIALNVFVGTVAAQPINPELLQSLRWRSIGPHRAGRVRAISGVPSQPNLFYMAQVNGGVWKTTDFGRTWSPIFDDQPTGSIGAIAVSASNPNIIYVGSGEGLQRPDLSIGDGVYKSIDAGKTWTHLNCKTGVRPAILQFAIVLLLAMNRVSNQNFRY